jgi:hypothetical protein
MINPNSSSRIARVSYCAGRPSFLAMVISLLKMRSRAHLTALSCFSSLFSLFQDWSSMFLLNCSFTLPAAMSFGDNVRASQWWTRGKGLFMGISQLSVRSMTAWKALDCGTLGYSTGAWPSLETSMWSMLDRTLVWSFPVPIPTPNVVAQIFHSSVSIESPSEAVDEHDATVVSTYHIKRSVEHVLLEAERMAIRQSGFLPPECNCRLGLVIDLWTGHASQKGVGHGVGHEFSVGSPFVAGWHVNMVRWIGC